MTKEDAIRKVLCKRAGILQEIIERHPEEKTGYYGGKLDGYWQAIELLSDDVECIAVELEDTNNF
jgi:hypothetical protein